MKRYCWVFILAFGLPWINEPQVCAQYKGARDYTKRLNPVLPPTRQPTAPSAPVAVPSARPTSAADQEKAKREKAERLQRTIEFEKQQAEAGSPTFQYELALRYLNGDGVDKDVPTAKSWLEKAAKKGSKDAVKKLDELQKQEADAALKDPKATTK